MSRRIIMRSLTIPTGRNGTVRGYESCRLRQLLALQAKQHAATRGRGRARAMLTLFLSDLGACPGAHRGWDSFNPGEPLLAVELSNRTLDASMAWKRNMLA